MAELEICVRMVGALCQTELPQEEWCPACRKAQGAFLLFEELLQDSDARRHVFDRLIAEGAEPLSVAGSGCTCYPQETTGGGHRANCPAWEPECTCYEVIGGHQPGCFFHGHKLREPAPEERFGPGAIIKDITGCDV